MMFAVVVFEIGSLICGVSPSMEVLILGRAIAGAGAAGIFSGALVIVAEITPLHSRSGYMAYVVSSVLLTKLTHREWALPLLQSSDH